MTDAIAISKLNDFIFCPKSLYFRDLYDSFDSSVFDSKFQTNGRDKHKTIDTKTFASKTKTIQSLSVYCSKYNLVGKIDIYNPITKTLIERKAKVKEVYDGYRYQLFAQYFAMIEMGYEINSLEIRSIEDNKKYVIELPEGEWLTKFESLVQDIKNYRFEDHQNHFEIPSKCANCIYKTLCH